VERCARDADHVRYKEEEYGVDEEACRRAHAAGHPCKKQFPEYDSGDFDCDTNYGGCGDASGCEQLPNVLEPGCQWRFGDAYRYHEPTSSNNPFVRYRRVRCPAELVAISGSTPNDDEDYPAVDLDAYA
jgi:hypothetical protein